MSFIDIFHKEETYKDKVGGDRGYITTALTKETFCYMKSKAVIITAQMFEVVELIICLVREDYERLDYC